MIYSVAKTYGNERGFTTVFRQHRAISHCNRLHGYALGFKINFRCDEHQLTPEGWVIDFGGLSELEEYLTRMFDHTLLVAEDDPQIDKILELKLLDVANVLVVEHTGCEAFAKLVYEFTRSQITSKCSAVTVFEHESNAATYQGMF